MGVEGIYTALGLLKGCKTDAGKGVVICAAGEGMGLSAAGGIFLNMKKKNIEFQIFTIYSTWKVQFEQCRQEEISWKDLTGEKGKRRMF